MIIVPNSVQTAISTIPVATTGHAPDASIGPSAVTARQTAASPTVTSDPLQFNNRSLRSVERSVPPTPSQVTIDPTPVSFDIHLITQDPESTVTVVLDQITEDNVSFSNATAVLFTDGNVTSTPNEGGEGQKLEALALEVPATEWVTSVSVKVAGLAGAGLMWCFKTFIIVRIKRSFLRQIGEAIGRTIIWGAERIRHIRAERTGGLLGRRPLPFERRAVY